MDNFTVKESPGKGRGLFSSKEFHANEILIKFQGTKLLKQDIPDFAGPIAACLLQIESDLYLDLQGEPSYFINHSCNPNCYIKVSTGHVFLISYIPIRIGDELTFDYSTTSSESHDTWSMPCKCSIFGCRKVISGFGTVPPGQQNHMIVNGMIPKYVLG